MLRRLEHQAQLHEATDQKPDNGGGGHGDDAHARVGNDEKTGENGDSPRIVSMIRSSPIESRRATTLKQPPTMSAHPATVDTLHVVRTGMVMAMTPLKITNIPRRTDKPPALWTSLLNEFSADSLLTLTTSCSGLRPCL